MTRAPASRGWRGRLPYIGISPHRGIRRTRTHSGGSGLGLAIVERIARLHGGSLTFRDREGGGLEAVVRLPLNRPAAGRNGA